MNEGLLPGEMYWGEPWPSGICEGGIRVDTPAGKLCLWCEEAIKEGEQGSFMGGLDGGIEPIHRECSLRSVLGGIGHIEDHEFWCKGPGNDTDGGRTKRQSALEVWEWVQTHGIPKAI